MLNFNLHRQARKSCDVAECLFVRPWFMCDTMGPKISKVALKFNITNTINLSYGTSCLIFLQFGCSTAALKQQMALNFELVVSDQLFTVVLASCKWFKISAPGVEMRHMWQLDLLDFFYQSTDANEFIWF